MIQFRIAFFQCGLECTHVEDSSIVDFQERFHPLMPNLHLIFVSSIGSFRSGVAKQISSFTSVSAGHIWSMQFESFYNLRCRDTCGLDSFPFLWGHVGRKLGEIPPNRVLKLEVPPTRVLQTYIQSKKDRLHLPMLHFRKQRPLGDVVPNNVLSTN